MDFKADGSTKITTRSRAHQQAQEGAAANPSSRDEEPEREPSEKYVGIFFPVILLVVLREASCLATRTKNVLSKVVHLADMLER
jgi:hypothetical protein